MLLLLLSHFSRVWLCATPQMAAHHAPPSLGFSRQEYWSGLSFPSPAYVHNGILLSCIKKMRDLSYNLCFSRHLTNHHGFSREGNGTPLQYSCLENPMDRRAWWAAVYGVPQSRTWLSAFTFTFHFHALEKEMANHSSVLAWKIPGMGEPGRLPSMGLHRVGQDWSDLAAAAAAAANQCLAIFYVWTLT